MTGSQDISAGVRPGDILAGKYRVERVLGRGGMGVVVAAHHIQLDEKVALKFLLPEALGNPEAVSRFVREARAAVKIKSEHVARVSDVGTLESGAPYMVMEYLEGADLSVWLHDRGALPVDQAADFVVQACVAVADAHALGIVHRDLKPANLFCVRRSDGELSIKVLDFGISKLSDPTGGMGVTKTSAVMGSPLYMSPEQMLSSKDVDAQTDIWALGTILFELLAARTVFLAETVTELAIKVASERAPSIRAFRYDVPPALEAVIGKCLEKDKRLRYANVAELAVALMPFAPQRAKASVDRILGILRAAGLSTSQLGMPNSGPFPSHAMLSSSGHAQASTAPAVGRTTVGASSKKTAAVGASIVGGMAVLATLAAVLVLRKQAHRDDPAAATSFAPVPAVSSVAAGSPAIASESLKPVDPTPATATLAAPSAPSSMTAPGAPAVHPVAEPANPKKKPANVPGQAPAPQAPAAPAAPAAPSAAAPAANCNPPYYFDARGNRVFKPECL
jgi:serine/threonine-protein kinase